MSSHSSNSFSTSSDQCCTLWGIASRYLVLTNLPQFSSRRRHIPPTLFLHLQTCVVLSWGIASRYLVLTNLPQFSSRRRHICPTLFLHLQTSAVLSEVLHHAIWYLPILSSSVFFKTSSHSSNSFPTSSDQCCTFWGIASRYLVLTNLIFLSFLQDVVTFLHLFLYIFRPVLYSLRYCITLSGTYQSYPPQFSSRRRRIPQTLSLHLQTSGCTLWGIASCYLVLTNLIFLSFLQDVVTFLQLFPLHLQTSVVLSEVLHHAIWYLPILPSSVFFKMSSHSSISFSTSSDQCCILWGIASRYLVLTNLTFLSFLQDVVTFLQLFPYIFRPALYSLRYCITLSGTYQSYLPQFSSRCRHIPPSLFLHLQTSVVFSEVLHHAIWYLPILAFLSFLQDVVTFLHLFLYIFRPALYSLRYCIMLSGTYQSYLPQFSSRRRHIPPTLSLHLQTSVVLFEVLHHAIWYLPILSSSVFFKTSSHSSISFSTSSDQCCTLWGIASRYLVLTNLIFLSFLQDVVTFLQLFFYIFRPVLYSLRYCITLSGTYQSYLPQFSSRCRHIPPTLFYIFRPVLYSLRYCITLSGTYQSYLPQFSSRRHCIPLTLFLHLQTSVVLSEVLHHAIWYLPILSSSVFFKTSSHSSNSFSTSSDLCCTLSRYCITLSGTSSRSSSSLLSSSSYKYQRLIGWGHFFSASRARGDYSSMIWVGTCRWDLKSRAIFIPNFAE